MRAIDAVKNGDMDDVAGAVFMRAELDIKHVQQRLQRIQRI